MKHLDPEQFEKPPVFQEAREELGLTQNELAQALGLSSDRAVRRYENGEREISHSLARLMWFFIHHGIPDIFRK